MATRKTNKKSSDKKATRKSSPKTTQASDVEYNLDKHPRPAEEYLETSEDMIPMGEGLDQHPRPVHQMETEIGFTSRSRTSLALFSSLCTRSSISTTGSNGDENNIKENGQPTYIGNYHKGLLHNGFGEVIPAAYQSLLTALSTPTQANFASIPLALGRKLTNPQSGLATDTEGPDPKDMLMRSAPSVSSAEAAAEAVELYWMALLRDVPFTRFNFSPLVATAAQELSTLTDFTGPKVGGQVTSQTIFRGCSAGVDKGPYLSQFLLKDIPYGSLRISQRQRTVLGEATLGVGNADYLTDFLNWLAVQNGTTITPPDQYDGVRRYIRDMRDLGEYVHVDALYEAYLNACLILLGMKAEEDDGNPYKAPNIASGTQIGFGTFGGPHILSLVCEVATRALKTVWYQKWFVHRRLRPEAYGGLIHVKQEGIGGVKKNYPIHPQVLNSQALARSRSKFGTYLLPTAFPEGSPTHPAYGAGHATVAGACVTVLKAWFEEDAPMPNPVVPTVDGTGLMPYTGPDAGSLTVGGELNKVAANIAIGRNTAGVHWRSDYFDSIRLGERVAICILFSQRDKYHEDYSFTFTSFDGETIKISKSGVTGKKPGFKSCKDRPIDVL
jgi:hypothetical protein